MSRTSFPTPEFHWQGRHDGEDGEFGRRVHHIVDTSGASALLNQNDAASAKIVHSGVALVGFACDAGVARNKGRIGAKKSPDLIRRALANLAWHHNAPIFDLGTVVCDDDNLEASQDACSDLIASALVSFPVITLGGGHEVAWSSFHGLAKYFQNRNKNKAPKIGIINFDAHFDLRRYEPGHTQLKTSSGTPFFQMQQYCEQQNWDFHYACLGVSRASNTLALFNRADDLNVWYVEDHELSHHKHDYHLTQLTHFIDDCDVLYLSIDLDVFPASVAPGVSAPAARGVSYDNLAPFLERILSHPEKLKIADIAEYNPTYDVDSQTAKLAARLCWDIANAMCGRPNHCLTAF